jgi:hypothetical protein
MILPKYEYIEIDICNKKSLKIPMHKYLKLKKLKIYFILRKNFLESIKKKIFKKNEASTTMYAYKMTSSLCLTRRKINAIEIPLINPLLKANFLNSPIP